MSLNNESAKKATILVVDDTPDNLTIMSNLLEDKYIVKVANRGEKGLKIARSDSPPDLILLDIMMPEMDGYEVCKLLKIDPKTADIPIVFLTAKNEADDEISGFTMGAVDYITKPIQADVTLARIKRHLAIKMVQDKQRDAAEKLRSQLVYMQKISSMGQLTAGVAHEFNNILGVISGYTEISKMIAEDIQDDNCKDDLGQNLSAVEKGVKKASSLIKKMLIYCNQHDFNERKKIDVQSTLNVINDVLSTLDETDNAKMTFMVSPCAENIRIDSTALHQIVTNLVNNAYYAIKNMPNGHVDISLQITQLDELHCAACGNEINGSFIKLRVSDNGCGMDSGTLAKIFDPFFTTKPVGDGVGLGLSVVSGIVHQACGHILVDSKLGEGTTFKLFLPSDDLISDECSTSITM
jgi:two-component system NtrC family sensor kinase